MGPGRESRRKARVARDSEPDPAAAGRAPALTVHVRPRAGRTALLGRRADRSLEVALRAAPEGGKANAELVALIARALGVPRSAVTIVRGAAARTKLVRVEGASPAALAALGSAAGSASGSASGSSRGKKQRGSDR